MMMKRPSPKQERYALEASKGHYFNLAWGPVRSGKTWVHNLLWVDFMGKVAPAGSMVIMAGQSIESLYNNVIRDIVEPDPENFEYIRNPAQLVYRPRNVKAICVGAANEADWKRITGPTVYGAYFNEITLMPESFFNMALTRITFQPQLILADCNPNSPGHYVKKRLIDRADELDVHHEFFTFTDNPVLTQEYVDRLHAMYSGVFYRRNVLGEWCSGEGAIYDTWDASRHVIPSFDVAKYSAYPHYLVIDFGFALHHAFCCQWWLKVPEGRQLIESGRTYNGPCWVLYREHYATGKTTEDHVHVINRYLHEPLTDIFCDHDQEAIAVLRRWGLPARMASKPKLVINGIQSVHQAISRNQIYIFNDALIQRDNALSAAGLPTCTAEEIPRLNWATSMKGEYEREDYAPGSIDHGTKNIAYLLQSVGGQAVEVSDLIENAI